MSLLLLPAALEYFARGGGGGSGGGGGGGGGSGGSGGGGGGVGVLAAGFIVTYTITTWFIKFLGRLWGTIVGFIATIMLCALILVIFRTSIWGPIEIVSSLVGFTAAAFGLGGKALALLNGFKKSKETITQAAAIDAVWDEVALRERVSSVFMKYQQDWSNSDGKAFYAYSTQYFAQHSEYLVMALKQLGRKNNVANPYISSLEFSNAFDAEDNAQDSFTAFITASADDQLIDERSNTMLFEDRSSFSEEWMFVRSGNDWRLQSITPTTTDLDKIDVHVQAFAGANKLYYREDMGWLLIPTRGDIFSKSKFGTSDINNHCIGMYKDMLLQFYTYSPVPTQVKAAEYTVAQVAMPKKAYGRVVVERKSGFLSGLTKPEGLMEIRTESVLLNKNYRVYAESHEAVSAFELLNPAYIERLLAVPFKISIEIYDNTLFLYSSDYTADYSVMLDMLNKAFVEMRL